MAKTLGNISYSEIVKNRDKVTRREGISKEIFEKLMQSINICGFENDEGSITVYFNTDDIEKFESVMNSSYSNYYLDKIDDRLRGFEDKLTKIYEEVSACKPYKGLENEIRTINERLDFIAEYASQYCNMASEIRNIIKGSSENKISVAEASRCIAKMDELMDKFDSFYGDIVRNVAYLRQDLKIEIGRKSFPKGKKTFFIYLLGAATAVVMLFILIKFMPRWFCEICNY